MGSDAVTVFGAYGHTGRFVVSELRKREWTPILSGRDPAQLAALGAAHPHAEIRPASVDDPASLDVAIAGAVAVINCAGPFATTAAPVIEAALRARIPYLDVAAEIEANSDTFEQFSDPARDAGIVIVPAMAFYGGLVAVEGMTAEKFAAVHEQLSNIGQANPTGRTLHARFHLDEEMRVFDVWESGEAFAAFGEHLLPILAQHGIDPGEPRIGEIELIMTPD